VRLASFSERGVARIGLVLDGEVADVTSVVPTMLAFVEGGTPIQDRVREAAKAAPRHRLGLVKLLAPFPRPIKNILCLGLNYKDHVGESARAGFAAAALPQNPIWFTKAVTSICGPYDDIVIDSAISTQYDWEVELAVVIGKSGRHISRERALDHVHSYTVFNDFSVRDVQLRGSSAQWFLGKSYDKGSPMGPWLVTADEVATPPRLQVACRVNGVVKQNSNTELLIFDIPTAIADISKLMTLEPGDIIATGTPSGVGVSAKPPEFLKSGDIMETEIEGLGVLRNRIVDKGPA
jgi:2-keto-4-pentenoate hydratase/2-oxohepta-3-ene-1,7-dioic acid hydratase in catechol pathway